MMHLAETQRAEFVRKGMYLKRRQNLGMNTLLGGLGTLVILILFTAGICSALRRRIFA
jgi:hypothetical protein